jgi:MFS family permease
VTYNDTLIVFAAALAAQGLTIFYGGFLGQKIGTPLTCLIGGYILVLGTYLSSLATSLDSMILTDGILFGMGLGICYTSPISCAVRWLPKKKGLATGIIVGGFGCGAFIFGNLATFLVNPNNKPVEKTGPNARYYDAKSEVVERVPFMFEMLAVAYFCCITVGSLLIFDPSIPSDNGSRFWSCVLPSSWTTRVSQSLTQGSQPRYQVTNTTDDDVYPNPLKSQLTNETKRNNGNTSKNVTAQKFKYKEVEMMLQSSSISDSSSKSDKFQDDSGQGIHIYVYMYILN